MIPQHQFNKNIKLSLAVKSELKKEGFLSSETLGMTQIKENLFLHSK